MTRLFQGDTTSAIPPSHFPKRTFYGSNVAGTSLPQPSDDYLRLCMYVLYISHNITLTLGGGKHCNRYSSLQNDRPMPTKLLVRSFDAPRAGSHGMGKYSRPLPPTCATGLEHSHSSVRTVHSIWSGDTYLTVSRNKLLA